MFSSGKRVTVKRLDVRDLIHRPSLSPATLAREALGRPGAAFLLLPAQCPDIQCCPAGPVKLQNLGRGNCGVAQPVEFGPKGSQVVPSLQISTFPDDRQMGRKKEMQRAIQ